MKDKEFLEKYNDTWDEVSNIIKKLIVNLYIIKISKSWKKSVNEKITQKNALKRMYLYISDID